MSDLIVRCKDDKWASWPALLANKNSHLKPLVDDAVEAIYKAIIDGWIMQCNWSAGKDSETVLHLLLMALVRAVRSGKVISQHHFLLHSDTGVENPEIRWLADMKLETLQQFITVENLPLTIVVAEPGLTQSWTGRILTGRGIPTFVNSSSRQCTHELKIVPGDRARKAFLKNVPKEQKQKVCMLLGSRDAESTTRKANIQKQGGHATEVTVEKGIGRLYAIKDWLASDVWEFLLNSGSADKYVFPSYLQNNLDTANTYKDATGECVWSAADKKSSDACGSRFGCWACCATGVSDRSMENMLESDTENYGYMHGLNRIKRYLSKKQYDWDSRHPMGRTIYEGGYVRIQPDVYSPDTMERILHVCCSIDYEEYKRALLTKLKLRSGAIEDTLRNRRMSEPQFQIITPQKLIHIDFMWAFHGFNARPFRALEIWHQVWEEGNLDLLLDEPDLEPVPRTPIPKAFWLKVGDQWGNGSGMDGLRDHLSEMSYFDGNDNPLAARVIKTPQGARHVVRFEEDSEITVCDDAAGFIISEEYPRLRKKVLDGQFTPAEAALYYLRFGAISIAKGKAGQYQKMMQRGQTYARLGLTGQQFMADILQRKDLQLLSNEEYQEVLARQKAWKQSAVNKLLLVDLTMRWHLHHDTPTGKWIEHCVELERSNEANRRFVEYYHSLHDQLLHYVRTSCAQAVITDESGRQILSSVLRQTVYALQKLHDEFPGLAEHVTRKVEKSFQSFFQDPARWVSDCSISDGDWLQIGFRKSPVHLKQVIKQSIRMLSAGPNLSDELEEIPGSVQDENPIEQGQLDFFHAA